MYLSDKEVSSSSSVDCSNSLVNKLRHWALVDHTSVAHNAITDLLHILQPLDPQLPLDSRTLLKTPVKLITSSVDNGDYCHFGLKTALNKFLQCSPNFTQTVLKVSFNIDGLPLFHRSTVQLWPILGIIKNTSVTYPPFSVGIFCGTSKPKPLHVYLEEFVSELQHLLQFGITYNSKHFKVAVHGFVCDAPAKAYVKNIKSYSGYYSCDKCTEQGEYVKGRVVFTKINAPKTTDH